MSTPIPDSYWVEPGRLLAGEYPGARLEADARARLERFAEAGISSFVDLTEADEGLTPYEHLLPDGVRCPLLGRPRPDGHGRRLLARAARARRGRGAEARR